MPLRSDPSLWFNLPGVVAAYQPVRAPDSLSARYNMAHGGDNRYRAAPGVLPAWSGVNGWLFNGSTQYVDTNIVVDTTNQAWSVFFRYYGYTFSGNHTPGYNLAGTGSLPVFGVTIVGTNFYFGNGNAAIVDYNAAGATGSDVIGVAGNRGYCNGRPVGAAIASQSGTITANFLIGARSYVNKDLFFNAFIKAATIYNRVLTPAEVWHASRQMAYCDVNPDWSMWSRRRQWYYGSTAGFLAAWAAHSNSQVGTGVGS